SRPGCTSCRPHRGAGSPGPWPRWAVASHPRPRRGTHRKRGPGPSMPRARWGVASGAPGEGSSGLVLVLVLVVLLLGRLFLQVTLEGRPLQMVADGLLEGVGDGQQGGLVEQSAGEQNRAGDLAAVALAEAVGEDGGRM